VFSQQHQFLALIEDCDFGGDHLLAITGRRRSTGEWSGGPQRQYLASGGVKSQAAMSTFSFGA